jgi:MFS family permease
MLETPQDPTASRSTGAVQRWLSGASGPVFSAYCIAAAFGTYFCMYAFRKPFTAGTFEGLSYRDIELKTILITSQVAGYTLSKFIGIKVVSEIRPALRALGVLLLLAIAEAALLGFAVTPAPWNAAFLFINGLPLGIVFGLVLSFLEGRRFTEALSAGLCASFIVSSGVVKSIGTWLVQTHGVSEFWMPSLVGLIFFPPALVFIWMLRQIPPPNAQDVVLRSERQPMNRAQRMSLFWRHRYALTGLVVVYVLLTVGRSIRDDFAVEIWQQLGYPETPSIFARSETLVMFGVVAINGLAICIRSNRSALLGSLALLIAGFATVLASFLLYQGEAISAFAFMVMVGLGTYVPYVAFHTTIFERFIAAFREAGNIGFLMYLADAMGYLGFVGLLIYRNLAGDEVDYFKLFTTASYVMAVASTIIISMLLVNYSWKLPRREKVVFGPPAALPDRVE